MPIMSQRGYARHRGVTHRAVQKAIADGRIETIDGRQGSKIDSAAADRQWNDNTSHGHLRQPTKGEKERARAAEAAAPPPPPKAARRATASDQPPPPPGDSPAGGLNYNQARAVREAYAARLARIDYEEKAGKLVPADEVRTAWAKIVAQARSKVLGLPSRMKAVIPHMTKDDVLLVEKLCRESLEEMVDGNG